MGLIFNDLNRALSVKTCYSRGLFSCAIIVLMMLLTASLFVSREPGTEIQTALTPADTVATKLQP